jgi:hypothetical protein
VADDANDQEELRDALKRAASALSAAQVPFALGGGYALWVFGAPEPTHDADLVIAEADVETAAKALADAGLRVERPPEGWLFKAWSGDALVDILHGECGVPNTSENVADSETRQVLGVYMPVRRPTGVLRAKLLSMDEHYCDFGGLLPVVRAVRESLDWDYLARETSGNPYAEAFLFLAQRLGISPELSAVRE